MPKCATLVHKPGETATPYVLQDGQLLPDADAAEPNRSWAGKGFSQLVFDSVGRTCSIDSMRLAALVIDHSRGMADKSKTAAAQHKMNTPALSRTAGSDIDAGPAVSAG
jgi:hypothetical protein